MQTSVHSTPVGRTEMKFTGGYQLLAIFAVVQLLDTAKRSRYQIQWHQYICNTNPEIITNIKCEIGPPDNSTLTNEIIILQEIPSMRVSVALLVPRPPRQTYFKVIDSEFDVCKFLIEFGELKLFEYIYKSMMRDSNQPKTCPFKKGLLYYRNITVLDNLPAFLPETAFLFKLSFYQPNGAYIVNITAKGELSEKNKRKIFEVLYN